MSDEELQPTLPGLDALDWCHMRFYRIPKLPGYWRLELTCQWHGKGAEYEFYEPLSVDELTSVVEPLVLSLWDRQASGTKRRELVNERADVNTPL